MKNVFRLVAVAAMLVGTRQVVEAHFKLLEPASWLIEDDRGDPQKAGPCGGTNTDYGKPSYAVTKAIGGSTLHVKVQETVYHPGHYRIALAVNSPTELPLDPIGPDLLADHRRRRHAAKLPRANLHRES